MAASLQELFVQSHGKPIVVEGQTVIQMDRIQLPPKAVVTIRLAGEQVYLDNAVSLSFDTPGAIYLSDGSKVAAVGTWDEPSLPRSIAYAVETGGKPLCVYNKFRTRHGKDFITEDSFTGNAGMAVTELDPARRLYRCSNGPGPFSLDAIVFELSWTPV